MYDYGKHHVNNNYFYNNLIYSELEQSLNPQIIDYRNVLLSVSQFNIPLYLNFGDVASNNITGNPMVDETQSYILNSLSPCINAGTTIEYSATTDDFDGDPFPVLVEDIGMQEYRHVKSKKSFFLHTKRKDYRLSKPILG